MNFTLKKFDFYFIAIQKRVNFNLKLILKIRENVKKLQIKRKERH